MRRTFHPLQALFLVIGIGVLGIGLAVGLMLSRSNQDVRQQASGGNNLATPDNCNPATHCCNQDNCSFLRYVYRQP